MKTFLPFVLETSTLFFLAFIVLTNVIIPLLVDLPLWWMFTRARRAIVDRRIREIFNLLPKQQPKTRKKTKTNDTNSIKQPPKDSGKTDGGRGGVRPGDAAPLEQTDI